MTFGINSIFRNYVMGWDSHSWSWFGVKFSMQSKFILRKLWFWRFRNQGNDSFLTLCAGGYNLSWHNHLKWAYVKRIIHWTEVFNNKSNIFVCNKTKVNWNSWTLLNLIYFPVLPGTHNLNWQLWKNLEYWNSLGGSGGDGKIEGHLKNSLLIETCEGTLMNYSDLRRGGGEERERDRSWLYFSPKLIKEIISPITQALSNLKSLAVVCAK